MTKKTRGLGLRSRGVSRITMVGADFLRYLWKRSISVLLAALLLICVTLPVPATDETEPGLEEPPTVSEPSAMSEPPAELSMEPELPEEEIPEPQENEISEPETPVPTEEPEGSPVEAEAPEAPTTEDPQIPEGEVSDTTIPVEPETVPEPDSPVEEPEPEQSEESPQSYVRYQGPASYTLPSVGGVGKQYIQELLIYMLYNGGMGEISCDYDGYVNTPGRHEGIDFTRGKGASVYALNSGEVTMITAGADGDALSAVAVYDRSHDKTVVYLHLAPSEGLYVGQQIDRGTFLGQESNRGATAAHTHVEVVDGLSRHANLSVNDYVLDNQDPYYYWAQILGELIGSGQVLYGQGEALCDGVEYQTLQDAVNAAESGQTVTLLQDVEAAVTVETSGIILDLNGKTVSSGAQSGIFTIQAPDVTLKNGTLTGENILFALYVGGPGGDGSGFTAEDLKVTGVTLSNTGTCIIGIASAVPGREIRFKNMVMGQNSGTLIGAWENRPNLVFERCWITGNSPRDGEELNWFGRSRVTFQGGAIWNNTGLEDGAVYGGDGTELTFQGSLISWNQGRNTGGISFTGTKLTLENAVIHDNAGQLAAGGIQMTQGNLSMNGGAVYHNCQPKDDGADICLGPSAVGSLPRADTMTDGDVDFSGCAWYRCNTGRYLYTEAALPGSYTAAFVPAEAGE